MTSTATIAPVSPVRAPDGRVLVPSAASVEASAALPIFLLLVSGIKWLLLGSLLGCITFVKLHMPALLAGIPFLTYGRTEPAQWICLLYGFGLQTGFGIAIWLTCRLSRSALFNRSLVILSMLLWNVAVVAALIAVLSGNSSGFVRLEFPGTIAPLFLVSAVLIGISILQTLHNRAERSIYVTSWFIFAALCWFPWILCTAGYFLLIEPLRGSVQPILSLWYANNLTNLCIAPFALAVIFYFVPKLVDRPLYSRGLAVFGFWSYVVFASWGGFGSMAGLPRWLVSVSAMMTLFLAVPGVAIALNWYATFSGSKPRKSVELSLIKFASGAFVLSILVGVLTAFRGVSNFFAYTHFGYALAYLSVLGLTAAAFLGAIHHIVPRLFGASEWPSARFSKWHYLGTVIGIALIVGGFTLAGLLQGGALKDAAVPFLTSVKRTSPGVGLTILGFLVFAAGQVMLLVNISSLLWRSCAKCCCGSASVPPNAGVRR